MIETILIVCVGNICRSPAAEVLLRRQLADLEGVTVTSAGLAAVRGEPADRSVISLLQDYADEISAHRGRQIDADLVHAADLILVMEQRHRKQLDKMYPSARGKVFLLGGEIPDPYGKSQKTFQHVLGLVEQGVKDWTRKIRG